MAYSARKKMQIRAQNIARNAAMRRLIEMFPEEYRAIYVEECEKRGVTPAATTGLVSKRRRIEPLIEEIKASGILDGVELPEEPPLVEQFAAPEEPIISKQRMTRADQLDAAAAGVPYRKARPDYVPVPPPPF